MSAPKIRFRPHRGGLDVAMRELLVFRTNIGFRDYLQARFGDGCEIKPYTAEDERVGWKNVHIVIGPEGFPVGFASAEDGSGLSVDYVRELVTEKIVAAFEKALDMTTNPPPARNNPHV